MTQRTSIKVSGRVLYLTEDPTLLSKQLGGTDLSATEIAAIDAGEIALIDNISTDELTPGWVCYYYDETLARYCLVGLRGGVVERDSIKKGSFSVIVSGRSKGCGSSRETAPYSERECGIQVVVAKSIEKIYGQNSQNIGLLTTTDASMVARLRDGESISIDEFTNGLDEISRDVVRAGGLFAYNKARVAGEIAPPAITTPVRKMTLAEKIIASRAIVDAKTGAVGVPAVAPGDSLFARTDVRFSHEYVTPMADALFRAAMGDDASVNDPASVWMFRDHLTFLDRIMPEAHIKMGLREQAQELATVQAGFAKKHRVKLYGEVVRDGKTVGSEAICHNKVIEAIALPGQLVAGTDSHTCMAGVLGCFAFGVGSTDMANAWFTKDVRIAVPQSVRFNLLGKLKPGVTAKDVMLHLLSQPFWKGGDGIGKVLEFAGDGVRSMGIDERATLTNMTAEMGGLTGLVEPDDETLRFLRERRGVAFEIEPWMHSDAGAAYAACIRIDAAALTPMVARPGDPGLGLPLGALTERPRVHIAYGGSCTAGKREDFAQVHAVLDWARRRGRRVAPHVRLYLQFGTVDVREHCARQGWLETFAAVGAEILQPSCGACANCGPGASSAPDQVTVSAVNRNFPGRFGPGSVWLASPATVAASAIAGELLSFAELQARA